MRLTLFFLLISCQVIAQSDPELKFIENKGQWSTDIDFMAQVPGGRMGVSASGFSILLFDLEEIEHRHLAKHGVISESTGQPADDGINGHFFRINLIGANPFARPTVENRLDGYYNYFQGNDSCRWATHALAYATIVYKNVYDGIDFRVSSKGSNLKYDFIVQPEADPSQIKMEYCGVDGVEKMFGALQIKTSLGTLTELKPVSYQSFDQEQRIIASEYHMENNLITFSFPDTYDECRTLTIDPLLIFSTYSGSTADNWGSTATPGEHGTLYSAGVTNLFNSKTVFFPTTPGAFQTDNKGNYDMAIIKYDSAGTKFLYATLLGGSNNDSPQSLVVDKTTGDLIVLGISSSSDYPISTNAFDSQFNFGTDIFNQVLDTFDQWDIVLTRFSPNGDKLIGSTFLGGTGNDGLNQPKTANGLLVVNYGDEMRGDVITDEGGNVYISSVTSSPDFPGINGFDPSFNGLTDGVLAKLSPDLSAVIWSSYMGGTGFDAAYSIKFDNDQNLVLAGGTTSTDFPVTVGAYQSTFNGRVDGWIARVAADGSAILHATFIGTSSFDQVYFIDLNSSGNIFCYGQTTGLMPVTPGVYNNPNGGQFVQKLSSDLSTLEFSTVFGSGLVNGSIIPNISPTAFLVNDCDNIYLAGWGGSVNSALGFWQSNTFGMPITNDAFQKTTSGSDFYFMILNGNATKLVYSTYLGGNSSKTHVDGGTSRFDKYGIVYHAVCSGCQFNNATGSSSSDFPTTPNAKSKVNRSQNCNNAAFKFDLSSLKALFQTNSLNLTKPGFNNVCYPDTIVFQNVSIGGRTFTWDFDDGTIVDQSSTDPRFVNHQYKQSGKYRVKLKITDLSTCSQTDSTIQVINYFKSTITAGPDATICEGNNHVLTTTGGAFFNWTSSDGTFTSSNAAPTVEPKSSTSYYVNITDANGCKKRDTINIAVINKVKLKWSYQLEGKCIDRPTIFVQNLTPPAEGVTFHFDFGDGTVSEENSLRYIYKQDGRYTIKLIAQKQSCPNEEIITLPFYTLFVPNVFTPEATLGYNDQFDVLFGKDQLAPSDVGIPVELVVVDRWGNQVFESNNYNNDWTGKGIPEGVYFFHLKVGDFASCKNWVHIIK